jgi:toxoflavin biosynthesis protein ToxD
MTKTEKTGWHWPQFDKILCGKMKEHELLGLPDAFISARFAEELPGVYRKLLSCGTAACAALVEDRHTPLVERLVAGNLLALTGDPRITPLDPAMILIEGGEVSIGLDEDAIASVLRRHGKLGLDEKWIRKECPRHSVVIRDFQIGKYPVTNQEYRDFLNDTTYPELPTSWAFRQFPLERSNHPVYTVTHAAAHAYAVWLSAKTSRKFRLPTEAEWEYAAGGKEAFEFPWGDAYEPDYANTAETGLFCSTPVGIFVEGNSPFGVADLAGNVEEYVSDKYAAYPGGTFIADHLVELNADYNVARGGGFARYRDLARTRRRHGHNPASSTYVMGFRLVEDV